MNVSIEAGVIDLIAKDRGLPVAKVTLEKRLLHDLGMDGDDAVEFFEDFGKRYEVDLAPLYQNWDRHFGREGFGSPLGTAHGSVAFVAGDFDPLKHFSNVGMGSGNSWRDSMGRSNASVAPEGRYHRCASAGCS